MNITRREFAAGAAAFAATGPVTAAPRRAKGGSFYGPTFGDRLWLWGHHPGCVSHGQNGFAPGQVKVDQAEACRLMDVPNDCVIRWCNKPAYPWGNYFDQFKDLKRVSFGIVDGSVGTVHEKMRIAFEELQPKMPNLTGCFLDDFFINKRLYLEARELAKVADAVHSRGLRLSVVAYFDQVGIKPEHKAHIELCDETSVWMWQSKNLASQADGVKRARDFIGPEKDLLIGMYMWDFSCGQPVSAKRMENQLELGRQMLADGTASGLIFHPSFAADLDLPSVKMTKAWIQRHKNDIWGTGKKG